MSVEGRVTDYDRIADRFDARYAHCSYDGVRETLLNFLGPQASSVLEVGCGTGYWLPANAIGVDPSAPMLAQAAARRARASAERPRLVRARAEDLPWRDATFDRVFCVNVLHHVVDRARFFAEARRVLRPGGGLLTIGKDPHTDRDEWWVYDYFEETRAIDLERFARVRALRGEMAVAGFAWSESMEADHIERVEPAAELFADGSMKSRFACQLTVLSDEEFARGAERLQQANEAAGGDLQLVTDYRLYATSGWV